MVFNAFVVCVVLTFVQFTSWTLCLKYNPDHVLWNLNQNESAASPLDYWGHWENHTYTPSPDNWRFPFYTLMLDRFVNGDPTNDDINGTAWEHDPYGTQLRHGGDVKGLQDTLDYIASMGIKGIYLAGSPMINFPWGSDAFSPLDLTLLDAHFATIDAWREAIEDMHARGMYVIFDNTMATLGDLIGFENFLNVSTPLFYGEHNALYKTSRQYHDFSFNNVEQNKCETEYPRWWNDFGEQVTGSGSENLIGCKDSEFDQYGDIAAFDKLPGGSEWQRQITKFASVQDRLREWKPSVREKIQHLSCIQIAMLDIDGFRMDKGQQITVDAQGEWADYIRQCAKRFSKNNFFIPGEIVSGNAFGAIYLGRGKEPAMAINDTTAAIQVTTNGSDPTLFLRAEGKNAFDAACFHYSTYRALTRFLGMDGDLGADGETPTDFIDAWNKFITTNDLINANTGVFDPRHMYGAQNQDAFRWPSIEQGTQKQNLANFITTLLLPGIPMLEWGEEQAYYLLDNTANNYVFGRQSMSSSTAWQDHGCYSVGNAKFAIWPPGNYSTGCKDDWNSLDHRDPSHPVKNIITTMFEMRQRYPVLTDGFWVQTISKQTHPIYLPGSLGTPTETGLWSVNRAGWPGLDVLGQNFKSNNVWIIFHNNGTTTEYVFDCKSIDNGLLAPFNSNKTVKNLLYPYDEVTLGAASQTTTLGNITEVNGCTTSMKLPPFGYKAYVPIEEWMRPSPVITYFSPGHDARIVSNSTVPFELHFSDEMNCLNVQGALSISSTTEDRPVTQVDNNSISCTKINDSTVNVSPNTGPITGQIPSEWKISGTLVNVTDGVHTLTVAGQSILVGNASTNAVNHFMFRVGQQDNPMVFPRTGNYSNSLLYESSNGSLYISHKATGADLFRYSLNWGSASFSDWMPYTGGNTTLNSQGWSGTKAQKWSGKHVIVQYWSQKTGSSNHIQQGDLAGTNAIPRRFPHVFMHGSWNQYGYDSGIPHEMAQNDKGLWQYDFMTEWPSQIQMNIWGSNPDGQPDLTRSYGDVDLDGVLDLLSPVSLLKNVINITAFPPAPHLAYHVTMNDADFRYSMTPTGSRAIQITLFILLAALPVISGVIGVLVYHHSFCVVKFNELGRPEKDWLEKYPALSRVARPHRWLPAKARTTISELVRQQSQVVVQTKRKTVMMATMEYDISDWNIKIKIGGLGVISQLMARHLDHMDLIWVVPCVDGIQYPTDQPAKPITITILAKKHTVQVQYHYLKNITYVVLDAPVFRKQTKADPYPARMDDIESAVFYSAWNSCIAEVIRRFPVDLYHINDYHGAVAPLHLLPQIIPCCLSLHNAEFQGLWAMRTPVEFEEVCSIYNLSPDVVRQYVQFGEFFNLLHAGASYLRMHQRGYGAAGVSAKYGVRSFARYPILWGLDDIGSLPNPDPDDIGDWDKQYPKTKDIVPELSFEAERAGLRKQAQEWAGLKTDLEAELFVFVGRWSMQKGVDLIADVFPAILAENSNTQLICIGPLIDLYGRFAAVKLGRLMQLYPDRVFSKPEFTALPPCMFSGAEFCLIPSRDEPFGLVAVEFGRKGALGIGARVGGLGNMPGWWYNIEAAVSKNLINQFKQAIQEALASKPKVRAQMRARAAKQRFPVAQWVEDLGHMQEKSIKISRQQIVKASLRGSRVVAPETSGSGNVSRRTPRFRNGHRRGVGASSKDVTLDTIQSGRSTRAPSPTASSPEPAVLSLGTKHGPGHIPKREGRQRNRLSKPIPGSRESSISAQSKRLTQGRDESGNTIPVGVGYSDSISSMNIPPIIPRKPTPGAVTPRGRNINRVSRITEIMDEDGDATADTTERVIQRSDSNGNIAGERIDSTVSSLYGSDEPVDIAADEYTLTPAEVEESRNARRLTRLRLSLSQIENSGEGSSISRFAPSLVLPGLETPSRPESPVIDDRRLESEHREEVTEDCNPATPPEAAYLSLLGVLQGKKDYKLQSVEPFFTDPTGQYYNAFSQKLENLNAKNSEGQLCIEEYLMKSEKDWFSRYRDVKMGKSPASTPASSIFRVRRENTNHTGPGTPAFSSLEDVSSPDDNRADQFLLQENYKPPTGVKRLLLTRIGTWPLYSFLLAFGQIIAANSYQITLLTGAVGQAAEKLYIIATIYAISAICWFGVFRILKSVYVLATPFAFYGMAFFLLGLAPYAKTIAGRGWVQNVATACYAAASSSGAFYFSLNFGSEGSVPVATWSFRAGVIQGSAQIYVVVLWFWGSKLTNIAISGVHASTLVAYGPGLTAITTPIALILWLTGVLLYFGLPDYYRQSPGQIPAFYKSVSGRRIVQWAVVAVLLQNFFLSAPYGRNWRYLFSSQHAAAGYIFALIIFFFFIIWGAILALFRHLSKTHTWILPIFAISLCAPRWCQMWWSTSGMGTWVPWAGPPLAGALLGRSLWLWLGVLDAVQGVGFGMILLQTLTRVHVTFVLMGSEVLGSIATIVARACAPDGDGPGPVFPNVVLGTQGLRNAWFWICLLAQVAVCAGFARWFRREQLMKP